jgi:hypothetical protein
MSRIYGIRRGGDEKCMLNFGQNARSEEAIGET